MLDCLYPDCSSCWWTWYISELCWEWWRWVKHGTVCFFVSMWKGSWGFNGALDENCLTLTKSSNKLWQFFVCPFYCWFIATVTYSMLTSWLDTYQTHQIHERLRSLQTTQETYGNIKRLSFIFYMCSSRGNVKKQNQLRGEPPKL